MKKRSPRQPPPQRSRGRVGVWLGLGVLAFSLLGTALWWPGLRASFRDPNPKLIASPATAGWVDERKVFAEYAGSATCKDCHEEAYAAWETSNHRYAERLLNPSLDRPAFEPPRSLRSGSQQTDVRLTDTNYLVTSLGLSRTNEFHPAVRVIGHDPLRQFLVSAPNGRLQTLEAAYDPHTNEWFNVYGNEDRQPGEWGHWTGRGMNWNAMCASCHNTRLRKNYDPDTDGYHTKMAEMTVGCEACHGPLKAHNEWQAKYGKSGQKDPTVAKLTREQTIDYCGFCHARRTDLTGDFKPGDRFLDHHELVGVDYSDRYFPDGQIRDENYEYASFLGSRMHAAGIWCLDCHNPHSAKTTLPGNFLCLRCHNGSYTNAPIVDPVSHSRHKVFGYDTNGVLGNLDLMAYKPKEIKETGGECVNCHMPQTAYMQRHWRHDHGFTSPDPLLTKQSGVPNACNRCHQDKDADWALRYCNEWYGGKMERPARRRAQIIAAARNGDPGARAGLLELLAAKDTPYWRAVVAGLLEPWVGDPAVTTALLANLNDTNALVRGACIRALEPLVETPTVLAALQPRLEDSSRNVRLAAAWALRATLPETAPASGELRHALDFNADQPTGQMQKGVYHFARHELERARQHMERAVNWDSNSPPFRHELAIVLSALNRTPEAIGQLTEATRLAPKDAEARYKLGLAYGELGDLRRAAAELATAVNLEARHARAWYNLGLVQASLSEPVLATESLMRAEAVEPSDARIPYARATILAKLGRNSEARTAASRALEIRPDYPEARELVNALSH